MTELLAAPASYFQRLHLERSQDGRLVHNVGLRWALRGALDRVALRGALSALVERHEVLRSGLRRTREGIVQVIAPEVTLPVREIDLVELLPTKRWRAVGKIAHDDISRAFDLTMPPLLRATLVRLDQHEHVLVLTASHAIWDGWSTTIALDDLAACYAALHKGEVPRLPRLRFQYADHVMRTTSPSEPRFASDAPTHRVSQISGDARAAGKRRMYLAATHPFPAASPSVKTHLQAKARRCGATLAMAVLAGMVVLLHVGFEQDSASIALNDANRAEPECRLLIGPFLSFLIIEVAVDPTLSLTDVLVRTRDSVLAAYQRRRFVDEAAHHVDVGPLRTGPVIHDAWLNFFPKVDAFAQATRPRKAGGLSIRPLGTRGASEARWNDGALGLTVREAPEGALDAIFVYDATRLSSDEIERFADLYRRTLSALGSNPRQRVGSTAKPGRVVRATSQGRAET